jgi:hypothetical protein
MIPTRLGGLFAGLAGNLLSRLGEGLGALSSCEDLLMAPGEPKGDAPSRPRGGDEGRDAVSDCLTVFCD